MCGKGGHPLGPPSNVLTRPTNYLPSPGVISSKNQQPFRKWECVSWLGSIDNYLESLHDSISGRSFAGWIKTCLMGKTIIGFMSHNTGPGLNRHKLSCSLDQLGKRAWRSIGYEIGLVVAFSWVSTRVLRGGGGVGVD